MSIKSGQKRLILLMLFLAVVASIHAQPREGLTISGHLTDVEEKEPIEQATIQLFRVKDSTFVGGTLTDQRGNFSV